MPSGISVSPRHSLRLGVGVGWSIWGWRQIGSPSCLSLLKRFPHRFKNLHQAADMVPGTGTGTIGGSPKPRPQSHAPPS